MAVETREEVKKGKLDKPIKRVTQDDLVELLLEQETRGANFVEVFSKTVPTMNKTGNLFYGKIEKIAETNCQINWFYDNAVQNRRTKEKIFEEFTPKDRSWGTHIFNPRIGRSSKTIIEHTNKKGIYNRYVQMRTLSVQDVHYEWIENGQRLTDTDVEKLKPFLRKRSKTRTQEVENEVIVSDYKVQSITMLSMNNTLYVIR